MPEDLKDLQRGLIGAEPLMVIGNAVAGAGREVQDAWDLVQSHLTGGKMPSMPSFSVPSFSMPVSAQSSTAPAPKKPSSAEPSPSDPSWLKIAAEHGGQPEVNVTIKSKPGEPDPSDIEWQQIAKQFGGAPEDPTGGAGQPVQYDTPLDFAKGLGSSLLGAVNPAPLVQMAAHPIEAVKGIGAAQGAVYDKARASFDKGDYGTAARHFVDFLLPIVGPQLDQMADKLSSGQPWRGSGEAVGLGLQLFGPAALAKMAVKVPGVAKNPNALEAAAVKFGQDHGIPIDAATATGNKAVQGVQFLADRSIAGSLGATSRAQETAKALERVGGELAQKTGGKALTPEQGGATIGDILKAKAAAHGGQQDVAYTRMRELAAQPEHQIDVPVSTPPASPLHGELRRIVHELDAMPFTKRLLQESGKGGDLEHVPGTGGAGAKVYHDIVQIAGSKKTRAAVQGDIEDYLAGGKETPIVKAAIEVAKQRAKGSYTVGKPEFGPSAMDVPTRLEQGPRFEAMGLPAFIGDAKEALRPLEREMSRRLPLTQQQANPGLHAIRQILEGPDWVPLADADRDLSALKTLAREQGGLAKRAVAEYGKAVTKASEAGSPEVAQSLNAGRAATVAKYKTLDVLGDVLKTNEEPVQAFRRLTAPKDTNINLLRRVQQQAPAAMKDLGRAYLEDLMSQATAEGSFDKSARLSAEWNKLGSQTKQALFPGMVDDLDRFFLLAKRLNFNPNPSGSGHIVSLGAQGASLVASPVYGLLSQLGGAGLSALLHSKTGVKLLTNGLSLTVGKAPAAAQAAAAARIVATAREMGLPVTQGARAGAPAPAATESTGR
jgi:hypothetical protein